MQTNQSCLECGLTLCALGQGWNPQSLTCDSNTNFLSQQIRHRIKQGFLYWLGWSSRGNQHRGFSVSRTGDKSVRTKVNKRRATRRALEAGEGPHPDVVLLVSEIPSHALEAGAGHVASEGPKAEALWKAGHTGGSSAPSPVARSPVTAAPRPLTAFLCCMSIGSLTHTQQARPHSRHLRNSCGTHPSLLCSDAQGQTHPPADQQRSP